jgi:acylphosphatase
LTRRYLVEGLVQGVGFRYFVRSHARRMNIRGWVRNTPDGRVEVVASAHEEVLELFAGQLQKGPELSRVDAVKVTELDEEPHDGFEVKF